MDSLLLLKSKLKPLGIYDLSENSIINAELSAYATGLDILKNKLGELERECFISTSTSYGLDLREKFFGYLKSSLSDEERRNILLCRYKITANDYTKLKIEEAVRSCGIDGYIVQREGTMSFDFNCNDNFETSEEKQEAVSAAQEFLPAHLECVFDFRDLRWNKIDENDYTFNYMDTKDLTWNQIDT